MSRFLTFLLGAILGLVAGAALIFYLFGGGAPRAAKAPGEPIKPPDPNGVPASTATVVLNQDFFNSVLGTIFRDMNAPAFPLNLTGQNATGNDKAAQFGLMQDAGCEGRIVVKQEGSGVNTGVRFANGKIGAPLAFSGSTNVPFAGCVQFTGWAQTNLDLRFDPQQQTVYGFANVETVNLDGISPLISGFITPVVQSSINQRVNPIQILRGQQLAVSLPIAASGGTLNANVSDVRAEVNDNELRLFVTYDLAGARGTQ